MFLLGKKGSSNKMWETTEINLCSESLRVKKVKTIHILATEKKSNYKVFFSVKSKKFQSNAKTDCFLKSEENYLYLTIPEKGTMSMFFFSNE